jgi:hypothetical protein
VETRQGVVRMSSRPIAFVLVLLSVVALALTGWYLHASSIPARSTGVQTPYTATGLGPDALERNEQLGARHRAPEETHGH